MSRVGEFWPEIMPNNKFHNGAADGKHYWLTPSDVYAALDAEFHFDFDPCPYPLPDGFDGLTCDWGQSNYVNPPFGTILHNGKVVGPTAWVRKAIKEHRKGKTVVFVWPRDKWELMLVAEAACAHVRNLGDVRWVATEDGSVGPGTGRHIACFVLLAEADVTKHEPIAGRGCLCGVYIGGDKSYFDHIGAQAATHE